MFVILYTLPFLSLKTTVCLRSNFAKWKYMRPGELYKLERIMILGTVRAHLIKIKIKILPKANTAYVNQHYDELKRCEGSSNQKVWFACSEKDNGPEKWLLCTCGEKVQPVWQIPNCCMHRSLWFCSDFLFLSFVFVCGCVTFHQLFETVQIVKAKAVAFHFDDDIWLMSS